MRILVLLSTTLLLTIGNSASAAEWLDHQALIAMVSGNTALCQHVSRPSSGRTYYDPDGTLYGIRRGEDRSGHWYVTGDTLCSNWGERTFCSRYQDDGNGGHFKYNLAGKKMVHIERWLAGDEVDGE